MVSVSGVTAEQFIQTMLRHVPFDGWSDKAMQMAGDDLGLSQAEIACLFQRGLMDLVEIGSDDIDRQMVARFMESPDLDVETMPVHLKIRELLLARFEVLHPNKEAVRKMLAFLAQPAHAKLANKLLYKTLDRIWRAAGDRATDFNFYTKRAMLGAVYGSTMLAFLDDDTPDMQKTRAFLDRRLADVAKIPKATGPLKAAASGLGTAIKQALGSGRSDRGF